MCFNKSKVKGKIITTICKYLKLKKVKIPYISAYMMSFMGYCIGNYMLFNIYSNAYSRRGQFAVNIRISTGKFYFEPSHT